MKKNSRNFLHSRNISTFKKYVDYTISGTLRLLHIAGIKREKNEVQDEKEVLVRIITIATFT